MGPKGGSATPAAEEPRIRQPPIYFGLGCIVSAMWSWHIIEFCATAPWSTVRNAVASYEQCTMRSAH
eukprot:7373761-Lingulodinium_polyedra.AAC.1